MPGRLKLVALSIHGTELQALMDSGAAPNLMSAEIAEGLRLNPSESGTTITVADGNVCECDGIVRDVAVNMERITIHADFLVVKKPPFNIIIGMETLESLEACIDLGRRSVRLLYDGRGAELPLDYERHREPEIEGTDSEDFTSSSETGDLESDDEDERDGTQMPYLKVPVCSVAIDMDESQEGGGNQAQSDDVDRGAQQDDGNTPAEAPEGSTRANGNATSEESAAERAAEPVTFEPMAHDEHTNNLSEFFEFGVSTDEEPVPRVGPNTPEEAKGSEIEAGSNSDDESEGRRDDPDYVPSSDNESENGPDLRRSEAEDIAGNAEDHPEQAMRGNRPSQTERSAGPPSGAHEPQDHAGEAGGRDPPERAVADTTASAHFNQYRMFQLLYGNPAAASLSSRANMLLDVDAGATHWTSAHLAGRYRIMTRPLCPPPPKVDSSRMNTFSAGDEVLVAHGNALNCTAMWPKNNKSKHYGPCTVLAARHPYYKLQSPSGRRSRKDIHAQRLKLYDRQRPASDLSACVILAELNTDNYHVSTDYCLVKIRGDDVDIWLERIEGDEIKRQVIAFSLIHICLSFAYAFGPLPNWQGIELLTDVIIECYDERLRRLHNPTLFIVHFYHYVHGTYGGVVFENHTYLELIRTAVQNIRSSQPYMLDIPDASSPGLPFPLTRNFSVAPECPHCNRGAGQG